MIQFDVEFNLSRQDLQAQFGYKNKLFPVIFDNKLKAIPIKFDKFVIATVTEGADYYEGEYTVIPKTAEQVLPTEKKMMGSDITIKEIPFFDVSNTSGGTTVYIANEIY